MTEPATTEHGTGPEAFVPWDGEATVPPEAAALLAAAGIMALTTNLANRWTLAGTAALAALGVAAVLVRRRRGPLKTGG